MSKSEIWMNPQNRSAVSRSRKPSFSPTVKYLCCGERIIRDNQLLRSAAVNVARGKTWTDAPEIEDGNSKRAFNHLDGNVESAAAGRIHSSRQFVELARFRRPGGFRVLKVKRDSSFPPVKLVEENRILSCVRGARDSCVCACVPLSNRRYDV